MLEKMKLYIFSCLSFHFIIGLIHSSADPEAPILSVQFFFHLHAILSNYFADHRFAPPFKVRVPWEILDPPLDGFKN